MKQRQLLWLGVALILLLGVAYVAGVFDTDFTTVDVPELDVEADAIQTVRASAPNFDLALQKEAEAWQVTEPVHAPADSATVRRVLEDLADLELRSVVSTNSERYGRYGVDSAGTQVTLAWEGGERTITIGDAGPGIGTTFVRLDGDESVYLADTRIRLPEDLDGWRDKTVIDLAADDVAQISIEAPGGSVRLERRADGWTLLEGGSPAPADSAAAARYLDRFGPLRADGFLDAAPASRDSSYTLRFGLETGGERVLELIPAGEDYAVTTQGSETIYRLRGSRRAQYAPETSYFKRE